MADAVWYLNEGGIDFSDASIQFTIATIDDSATPEAAAIRFRRQDEDNWWEFGMSRNSSVYKLEKSIDGESLARAEPGTQYSEGDVIEVRTFGSTINCYVNRVLVISVEDSDFEDEPTVGIRISEGSGEGTKSTSVDDFHSIVVEDDLSDLLTFYPYYEVFVDWDEDDGLTDVGNFEIDENGWTAKGTRSALLNAPDTTHVRSGLGSLRGTWRKFQPFIFGESAFGEAHFVGDEFGNPSNPFKFDEAGQGFDDGMFGLVKDVNDPLPVFPTIEKTFENFVIGRNYELRAWVYVPAQNTSIGIQIDGIAETAFSTQENKWEELSVTFTATSTSHTITVIPSVDNPNDGDEFWIDEAMFIGDNEDITEFVLGTRDDVSFRSGRDIARSLSSISPGEVEMELLNTTQIFSPDNPGSLLAGFLNPGKPVLIRATYNDQTVNLFHGFVDNYVLNPAKEDQSVNMSCTDGLQFIENAEISTELYPSLQTGQAINIVLDHAGWPKSKRSIDHGATTLAWWWEEDTSGLESIEKIVKAEGLPSIAYVDKFNNFIFKDRHHRQLSPRSKSIQAVMRSNSELYDEPNFSFTNNMYDIGWKDIINHIEKEIITRHPHNLEEVWKQDGGIITIEAGQTKEFVISSSEPFFKAKIPSESLDDYEVLSGSVESITLSRTSGQSATLKVKAGASELRIKDLRLRAYSIHEHEEDSRKIVKTDPDSIDKFGKQSMREAIPWANFNDLEAIAEIILGNRSERLPVVRIALNNGHPVRITNLLHRQLSDRIHITESEQTFMDDDFFIEVIEHEIKDAGQNHVTILGCEKAREQKSVEEDAEPLPPQFTFDDPDAGFNNGFFSPGEGFTLADDLFILGQSKLSGDEGLGF